MNPELDILRDLALLDRDGLLKPVPGYGAYLTLFASALNAYVKSEAHTKRRAWYAKKFNLRGWTGRVGVSRAWHWADGNNYHCVVCGESLHTAGRKASFVADPVITRMRAHVALCLSIPKETKK